jgi:high-affinity K+ transport system ATPase subunit B
MHSQEPHTMSEELQELHEHAEHAREHPDLAPVTLTMAVLAVLVATVSLLGHRTHTEEIILQNKVTDQWAYYQAKNIRLHTDELFADLAGMVASKNDEAAAKLQEKTRAEAERYKDDKKELEAKGHELEQEFAVTHRKADRFDLAEVFLEIALVITSITLLSGRRIFWHLGLLTAAAGVVVAASVLIVH